MLKNSSQPIEIKKKDKPENPLINILVNIVFPAVILSKASDPEYLGPIYAFVVALSLPTLYGAYDFIKRRKHNIVSILGFASILLTGGLGLMQVGGIWFAVKEAAIPAIIGIVVIGSLKTKKPLVKTLLFNDNVINVSKVTTALTAGNKFKEFDRLLLSTTFLLAASFLLSSILNFFLAVFILKSPPGTAEFNAELGKMTALSYPVIVIPSMVVLGLALWKLLSGIKALTGLQLEEIFNHPEKKG
jgi:intracellular septation protein A